MLVGTNLNSFSFQATNHLNGRLEDYKGQYLVLYFYPKDSTPGCTTESQDFRDAYIEFQQEQCQILGISRDSLKSHELFKSKHELPFELISDPEEHLCTLFDVIKMKSMYGKSVRGIERSTFLIDPSGTLIQAWRKVKVKDHVSSVLEFLKNHKHPKI